MSNSDKLRSLYEEKFGQDLTWENLQKFIPQVFKEERKTIATEYKEKTTLMSGKFVGDRRVISLIKGEE